MSAYRCGKCGRDRVRLFRPYNCTPELRCSGCLLAAGVRRLDFRFEWWVAAVPINGWPGAFHATFDMPKARADWWFSLPERIAKPKSWARSRARDLRRRARLEAAP